MGDNVTGGAAADRPEPSVEPTAMMSDGQEIAHWKSSTASGVTDAHANKGTAVSAAPGQDHHG